MCKSVRKILANKVLWNVSEKLSTWNEVLFGVKNDLNAPSKLPFCGKTTKNRLQNAECQPNEALPTSKWSLKINEMQLFSEERVQVASEGKNHPFDDNKCIVPERGATDTEEWVAAFTPRNCELRARKIFLSRNGWALRIAVSEK